MMKVFRYAASLLLFVAIARLGEAATIRGIVLDGRGHAIEGATVTADTLEPGSRLVVKAHGQPLGANVVPQVTTDGSGRFTIVNLAPATYSLFASKVEDGYGDTENALYALGRPAAPRVRLSDPDAAADVTIQLGRRGGVLVLRVVDAATRRYLPDARLEMTCWSNGGKLSMSTLIPERGMTVPLPIVRFRVTVSATGNRSVSIRHSMRSKIVGLRRSSGKKYVRQGENGDAGLRPPK